MSVNEMLMAAASSQTTDVSWDISYAQFVPFNVGNIANTNYTRSYSVAGQESQPRGIYFKPDGTSFYLAAPGGTTIHQYTIGTAWQLNTVSYNTQKTVGTQDNTPTSVFLKPDGTKMYVTGSENDSVYEYSLSTAWDVSTASYVQSFSVSTESSDPTGIFFKPDGTKMYITNNSPDNILEYTLSTAWNVSTASYVQSFSVSTQDNTPYGLFFSSDGTSMYHVGATDDDVSQYSLSTAWDISTASHVRNYAVAQDLDLRGLAFSPDFKYMYICGNQNDSVYQYTLAQGLSVVNQETGPSDLFFKSDGTKLYIVGSTGDEVNEYTLSTAWDISTASASQVFSVATQETNASGIFFTSDGTRMYITGSTGDDVNQYNLSTAWDISTASYDTVFSVALQETAPSSIFFKPDGTKMYISGVTGDDINEYNLSNAWDVSTASYVQNFSVVSQTGTPGGIFFKPDGTRMYITESASDSVLEYSLSTAWNISTASYVQSLSISNEALSSTGIFFKPDGLSFWVTDSTLDAVFQYNLVEA